MVKKVLIPSLTKAHVDTYTRKDGVVVQAHEDKRQAAKPDNPYHSAKKAVMPHIDKSRHGAADEMFKEMEGGGDESEAFGKRHFGAAHEKVRGILKDHGIDVGGVDSSGDHPNVVGKVSNAKTHEWEEGRGNYEQDHKGPAHQADSLEFAGRRYNNARTSGNSVHDQRPVHRFEAEDDSNHRIWVDEDGNAHADSKSEVKGLREKYEKSQQKAEPKKRRVAVTKKPKAKTIKTENEGYGFHGEAQNQHFKEKHGPEYDYGKMGENDWKESREAADASFSDAANKLVDAGHFDSHEDARDYLDSRSGRHLHNEAFDRHGGDVTKVGWLAKDAKKFKRSQR